MMLALFEPVEESLGLNQPSLLGGLVHELALDKSVALVVQLLSQNGPHQRVRAAYLSCNGPHGHWTPHHVLSFVVTAAPVGLPLYAEVLLHPSTGQKVIVQLGDLLDS